MSPNHAVVAAIFLAAPAPLALAQEAQNSVVVFDAEFFRDAQLNNAREMVDRLPGFTLEAGDENARGLSASIGNVLIDGQRPNSKTDTLDAVLRRLNISQIERIELIRGGAPGIDMQGKTVVANIIRSRKTAATGQFVVQDRIFTDGRQAPLGRFELSRRSGDTVTEGFIQGGGYAYGGIGTGIRERRDLRTGETLRLAQSAEADGTRWDAGGSHERPLFGGKIKLNAAAYLENYYGDLDLSGYGALDRNQRELIDTAQTEFGARWNTTRGRDQVEVSAIRRDRSNAVSNLTRTANVEFFNNDRSTDETIARAVLRRTYSPKLAGEVGLEGALNTLESRTTLVRNGRSVSIPAAQVEVEERRGEAFSQVTWKPLSTLSLEGGVRYEISDISASRDVSIEKSLRYLKPRLAAAWSPTSADQLRVRLERTVGQINFDDFVADSADNGDVRAGNPDLVPQQAWIAEISYEHRFWGRGSASLTYRRHELSNVIDRAPIFSPTGVFDAPANIGDGSKDVFVAALTLPLNKLAIPGGLFVGTVTYQDTAVIDPTTGKTREISVERPVLWSIRFSQDIPSKNLTWGIDALGQERLRYYRYSEVETRKFNTMAVAYVELKPNAKLNIRLEAYNPTARTTRRNRDLYEGGRRDGRQVLQETQFGSFPAAVTLRVRRTFG